MKDFYLYKVKLNCIEYLTNFGFADKSSIIAKYYKDTNRSFYKKAMEELIKDHQVIKPNEKFMLSDTAIGGNINWLITQIEKILTPSSKNEPNKPIVITTLKNKTKEKIKERLTRLIKLIDYLPTSK